MVYREKCCVMNFEEIDFDLEDIMTILQEFEVLINSDYGGVIDVKFATGSSFIWKQASRLHAGVVASILRVIQELCEVQRKM